MTDRKQWFIDRIGKRIWRINNYCPCKSCQNVYEHGIIVSEFLHADYLFDVESEGVVKYFETKEERDRHERKN